MMNIQQNTEQEIKRQIEELQQKLKNIKKEENKNKPKERYFYKFYVDFSYEEEFYDLLEATHLNAEKERKEFYEKHFKSITLDTTVMLIETDYFLSNKRTKVELQEFIKNAYYEKDTNHNDTLKDVLGFTTSSNSVSKKLRDIELTGSDLKKAKAGEIKYIKLLI